MSGGDFDVVVIGAGMAGASAAARLAERRRVLVLEGEAHPGFHATGRSAALYSATYGGPAVRALTRASHDFLHRPPAGFAPTPLTRPRGALHIATRAQRARLAAFAAQPDVACATRQLAGREVRALCPILRPGRFVAGVLEPGAADIDVDALHQGFLRALRRAGGDLRVDAPVEALRREGGAWRVTAGGESWTAPVVVNAAGAWADAVAALARVAPIGLRPLRRTALLIDGPPGEAFDAWPMVIDADERFYFKPDAGRLLLSPADETPAAPGDAQAEEWDVAQAVSRFETATGLSVRRVARRWAGLRTFAPDRAPVVGFDPAAPGFFWLAGQGGYGIQTAPALAAAAAALIRGGPIPRPLARAGVRARDLSPRRGAIAGRQGRRRGRASSCE